MHHYDPFLRIGPFNSEIQMYVPFRIIFHDFLEESEVNWILNYSKPRLSESRYQYTYSFPGNVPLENKHNSKSKGNKIVDVHKAVQTWMSDIVYSHDDNYTQTSEPGERLAYTVQRPIDMYQFTIENELMLRISKRVEAVSYTHLTLPTILLV